MKDSLSKLRVYFSCFQKKKEKKTTNKETKRGGGLEKKTGREMPILGEKVAKPEGLDEHNTGIPMD